MGWSGASGPPTKAHVFVNDLDGPELSDTDRHHVERVLRVRPGEEITVSDGAGGCQLCVLRARGVLEAVGKVVRSDPPQPPLTVAFAVAKGERTDWAVQKVTELGVDRIIPLQTARTVVRWEGDRARNHVERLRRVAREAAMQSRRSWLPTVDEVSDFATVAALPGAALADRHGVPPSLAHAVVLVGPEGGWDQAERDTGLPTVALGPNILRVETAAVAAGTLLSALRGGLVEPRRPLPGREWAK